MRLRGLPLLVLLVSAAPASAQSDGYRTSLGAAGALRAASRVPAAGSISLADAGFTAARRFSSRAPGATLMIIGGAAIVAGILVGGDGGTILILGGVGVGAYGVYLYTQ
jgi:hypothetical protein